jgi:tetratricopeptide (TPR) repeat protein
VLKNGDRIVADFAQERNGRVEYSIGDNTLSIPKSIVARIEKGSPVVAPAQTQQTTVQIGAKVGADDLPPVHEEIADTGDLFARVIRNGAVDTVALRAIENEGLPERSATANSIAANFEERRSNLPAAAHYLQAALVFLPDHTVLLENYTSVLLQLGRAPEAVSYAMHATRSNPQSADAFMLLGHAFYKNDHNRDALMAFKKSLQLRPDPRVQQVVERIERESNAEAEFRQQETSHFTLRYEGSQAADALRVQILESLETDFKDLSNDLGSSPRNVFVSLYTDQAFFDVTHAPAWSAALNDGKIRVPISGVKSMTGELAQVLRHELTHSFIQQITHGRAPQWLHEGLAQVEEGKTTSAFGARLAALYASGHAVPLNLLEGSFGNFSPEEASVAYAESLAAVEYIRSTYGMSDLARLLQRLGEGQPVESALRSTIHEGYSGLEAEVTNYLKKNYGT